MTENKVPTFVQNKDALADLLGVSRATVQRASALPGWPKARSNGTYHVAKCKAFIEQNFKVLEEPGSAVPDGYTSWNEFKVAQQGLREKLKRMADEGRVADKPFVQQMNTRAMHALYAELRRAFCSELPAICAGLDPVSIETKNAEALESAFSNFKASLTGWTTEERK